MKDLATKERFVELRAKGNSLSTISGTLSVAKSTLVEWSKELAVEVSQLRHGEMEAVMEKYRIQKEQRLQVFGEQLEKVREELSKRDYSKVPTEKLIDLSIKLVDAVRKEEPKDPFAVEITPIEDDSERKEIEELRNLLADDLESYVGSLDENHNRSITGTIN